MVIAQLVLVISTVGGVRELTCSLTHTCHTPNHHLLLSLLFLLL